MLTIRMQRTGRKGLANFRVVVQDSRFSPASGRVVAQLGHYNPHTKETVLDKEEAEKYLQNGAQPSPRVVKLLEEQKVKFPEWVERPANDKKRATRNPEKLRKNQPKEEAVEAPAEEPAPEAVEVPAEETAPAEAEEKAPEVVDEPKEASDEVAQSDSESEDSTASEKPAEA